MTQRSSSIAALVLSATLLGGAGTASAQGYGYGSAGGAAASLGFTASPPIARNSNTPAAAAVPAADPVTTGSIVRRDRSLTRLHRR